MKQAVMYGGGNIGRGFIGATLSQSGYKVTFIDVAEPVVKALQEKEQYPVRYVSSEGHEDVVIEHVTAVNGNDQEAASEAIANCDIMATAVGARILKFIVGNIVAGLRKRWARDDRPLNIIICENLMDANKVMEGMLKDLLTDEEKKHFDEKVGLVEASIGRMVPVQTEEMKDGDPMRVCVERYGFLPVDKAAFKGEIPEITNMVPFEPFDFYIKRKLYVHNMGHATCAYLGGYEGRKYIYQSIDDPEILNIVQNAMLESALALHKKYGVELRRVLTGFKYIGEQIALLEQGGHPERYIFGFEESYGYLSGTHARDKDAVNAVLLICEAAAWYAKKGMTLGDAIDALYAEIGCYCNAQKSFAFAGETGREKMASLMQGLRTQPLREIAGLPVEGYTDYEAEGTGLPKANVLEYRLPGGSKVIIRPSGTEPKIKAYLSAVKPTVEQANAQLARLAEAAAKLLA